MQITRLGTTTTFWEVKPNLVMPNKKPRQKSTLILTLRRNFSLFTVQMSL